jgi:hypothetical protein
VSNYVNVCLPVTTRVPPTGVVASAAATFSIYNGVTAAAASSFAINVATTNNVNLVLVTAALTAGTAASAYFTGTTGYFYFTGCEL